MGVKHLWNILASMSERMPLFELHGKAIAIDLSGWVVASQTVMDASVQNNNKMFLRNLYCRASWLLLHGIMPVFVLDGRPPDLKQKTIAKRLRVTLGKMIVNNGKRGRLDAVLTECEEMLRYMGLHCVRSHGEAEALCAHLNEDGLVDGCVSQDSDCFLYGARVVYRNFCTSDTGNRFSGNGSVDTYKMEKIERVLGLGRKQMIALALLCGCDYDEGLTRVGKEAALKLFRFVKEEDILDRLKSWRTDDKLARLGNDLNNGNLCPSCGHRGKLRVHAKSGCQECGTTEKCSTLFKGTKELVMNEVSLRKKAIGVENFPNQELINEFLIRKDPVPSDLDLEWHEPQILEFTNLMRRQLGWPGKYSLSMIFPLVTRWQLLRASELSIEERQLITRNLEPECIRNTKNVKGVASYDIVWKKSSAIIPPGIFNTENVENEAISNSKTSDDLVTTEPQIHISRCYPDLVEKFRNSGKRSKTAEAQKSSNVKPKKRRMGRFKIVAPAVEESSSYPERSRQKVSHQTLLSEYFHTSCEGALTRKQNPRVAKVLATEQRNKLDSTLETMYNKLTPEDFNSDYEDGEANISEVIDKICNKQTQNFAAESRNVPGKSDSEVTIMATISGTTPNRSLVGEIDCLVESHVPLTERINTSPEVIEID
ncbi:flap endonuclease GEN [Orussus abietinus]|uniref:flap endonuclease GEN n=1 Tax=Orussus abietinus TaxID=222816 RepID=UPI0006262984|nr:flap endonuclease GEN [Orussus abietinus]XP_012281527.1 flap endonuclease GEN [Orussus abietinus]